MGPLPSRWLVVALVAAVALPALALAQDAETEYVTPPKTVCWSCHQTPQKAFPKLTEFFGLLPPESAGEAPGTPFPYIVQVQNAWGADLDFIRPTMDLSNAPSLAFASTLDPLLAEIAAAIPIERTQLDQPQAHDEPVPVPFGYSKGAITLTPVNRDPLTGPALRLKVWGGEPSGEPVHQVNGTRGQEVSLSLDRDAIEKVGYGNWTVRAETTLVTTNDLGNLTLPPSGDSIAYNLKVDLQAEAITDRVQSLPSRDKVLPGQARAFTYTLVFLSEPGQGETVKLWADAMVFYDHEASVNPDYGNTTREFTPDIEVGPGATLAAETSTIIIVPGVQNGATMATVSEIVGYASVFLLVASVWTGGMFGKASRRQLNTVFGSAKRRVAFHNFLSYGILLAASIHTVLFIIEQAFYWTVGIIWGGLGILAMLLLGVTGAFQVQMIRRWNYATWRWTHYGLAVAAIVFSLVHGLLDGVHFDTVQDAVGWSDPLDPRDLT